ncbi:hypothetical protein E2562_019938 [Oryza meyeriana var. granulata]|uniref:Uncharacterized protein n=1 Tax=Oryza meyeriana var. granulata TaxID=110450 RepID=A0A6G1EN25_9ORYZ|nr:hypothetical protein E2562_019938 [Oryza meyeriana var. granulata]
MNEDIDRKLDTMQRSINERGLVFCTEDRAIRYTDCDDPIHSANELTANHSRFLLFWAKLSAALADQAIPSSDCSSDDADDVSTTGDHSPAAIPSPDCSSDNADEAFPIIPFEYTIKS